ncbi:sulfurtransferase TusA family protein [Desulfonema magnum]|uniref:Sulfurtransferase TusA-like domain-containing protein n=1 Tax=Desulfonema magnum TaxID=45655 RepID=A0A975GQ12_9BACT|nr:sulfurtransferase TusA family protein [Desulfonema magnum]QTA89397.1 Sulfurtransferase TusA-like domain-containing protein [Desulfonema magnum]
MSEMIDARGLSCPQPVLMFMEASKKTDKDEIVVWVDTDASKENVSRAAESKGWEVKNIQENNLEYQITLTRN